MPLWQEVQHRPMSGLPTTRSSSAPIVNALSGNAARLPRLTRLSTSSLRPDVSASCAALPMNTRPTRYTPYPLPRSNPRAMYMTFPELSLEHNHIVQQRCMNQRLSRRSESDYSSSDASVASTNLSTPYDYHALSSTSSIMPTFQTSQARPYPAAIDHSAYQYYPGNLSQPRISYDNKERLGFDGQVSPYGSGLCLYTPSPPSEPHSASWQTSHALLHDENKPCNYVHLPVQLAQSPQGAQASTCCLHSPRTPSLSHQDCLNSSYIYSPPGSQQDEYAATGYFITNSQPNSQLILPGSEMLYDPSAASSNLGV